MLANLLAALPLALAAGAPLASGAVTPSGPSVPENLLRIEVLLDRPLGAPLDMRFVHLYGATGKRIDDALLDLALPDQDGRRFAVLMHPGRVKSGVGPNLALGPALREGDSVTLVVDDPRQGRTITKRWRVGAALRDALAPARWQLDAPAAGRQALSVTFPSAINASAASLIAVAGADGRRLAGKAWLDAGETVWRFVPSSNWRPGAYQLRVHPSLEDPAGNRLCSAFEQPNQRARQCDSEARVAFRVEPARRQADAAP